MNRAQIKKHIPIQWRQWVRDRIVREFARLFYERNEAGWSTWLGVEAQKNPADLWIYQEILSEVRPELIIETGTMYGGSAFYLASICDLIALGEVVTIDIEHREGRPAHPRIEYVTASSTDPSIVATMTQRAEGRRVLVILDSDHSRDHVMAELDAYADLVSPGSYLIVEDTNINGHPVLPKFGPGPWEALDVFLPDPRFEIDRSKERFLNTFNPRGYLRRIGGHP
jgi:cephalosporin hydroxylase